jgi:hypothetical protein
MELRAVLEARLEVEQTRRHQSTREAKALQSTIHEKEAELQTADSLSLVHAEQMREADIAYGLLRGECDEKLRQSDTALGAAYLATQEASGREKGAVDAGKKRELERALEVTWLLHAPDKAQFDSLSLQVTEIRAEWERTRMVDRVRVENGMREQRALGAYNETVVGQQGRELEHARLAQEELVRQLAGQREEAALQVPY